MCMLAETEVMLAFEIAEKPQATQETDKTASLEKVVLEVKVK